MKPMTKSTTFAAAQKRAVILIAAALLLLIAVFLFVNYLVSIETFTDLDGTEYTIEKKDGAYLLVDKDGNPVEKIVDDNGIFFSTKMGTLVSLSDSGAASIYAVVDTEGLESVSTYNRLMMYARIQVADINRIDIKNEYGSYTFERQTSGGMLIKGRESSSFDEELLAYLQSVCGNTTVNSKISPEAVATYGYAEYGLETPRASLTVTTKAGLSHTIEIGKATVDGYGYYVRLKDSPSVYIFNTYIGDTALVPLETYVTPVLLYPISGNNYMFVENFRVDSLSYDENGKLIVDNDVALSYWDYAERQGTEFQSQPYYMTDERLSGYTPSADSVYTVMYHFLDMSYKKLISVDPTAEDIKRYGLDKPIKSLYYEFTETDTSTGTTYHAKNYLFISELTENGTYYVTSEVFVSNDGKKTYVQWPAYNQIIEIDRSYLPFVEWDTLDWVERDYFRLSIDLCDFLIFSTNEYGIVFDIVPVGDDIEAYVVGSNAAQKLSTNNFKTLYLNMQYGKFYGSTNMSEEEIAAVVADPSRHLLTWSMRTTKTKLERTYDYYWLDENRTLVTVNGVGEFYVMTSAIEKLISDAFDVATGVKITAISPYTNIDQ